MADKERKWIKRCGKRFYPYTDTEAVLNPDDSPYENLEERLAQIEAGNADSEIPKFKGISDAQFTMEETGYAGNTGEVIYSTHNKCFVLKVPVGLLQDKFYNTWGATDNYPASTTYNNGLHPFANILYALTGDSLALYMYTEEDGLIGVSSSGGGDSTEVNSRDIYFVNGNYSSYDADNPSQTPNGKFNTNEGSTIAKGVDLSPLFEGVNAAIEEVNQEDYRKNGDNSDEKLYPEYYLTTEEKKNIVYCPDYYNWNKVWYKDDISNITVQETALNASVRFPEEYMASSVPDIENFKITKVQQVYARSGVTACAKDWLSTTSGGDALTPERGVVYRLAEATTGYSAGTLFKYTGLYDEEIEELSSSSQKEKALELQIYREYSDDVQFVTVSGTTVTAELQFLTEDVYYYTDGEYFVLKTIINGTVRYYNQWKNSALWNATNGTAISARQDTVYCPITKGDVVPNTSSPILYRNLTWVLKDSTRTNIGDTFTDFRVAISDCLAANNGNICFHSTKIYGVLGGTQTIQSKKNFVINGQNAVLCYVLPFTIKEDTRTDMTGHNIFYRSVFKFEYCDNATIKNFKIYAIKDTVCNTASAMVSSYSIAPVCCIDLLSSKNIVVDNIEAGGFKTDIQCKKKSSGNDPTIKNITIRNWKSDDSGGIYASDCDNFVIDNSYLHTGKFSGIHLIYFGELGYNIFIRNSTLIQDSIFNTNFVQWKRGSSTTPTKDYLDPSKYAIGKFIFDNCYLKYGGRGLYGGDKYNKKYLEIHNSIVEQTEEKRNGSIVFWGASESGKGSAFTRAESSDYALIECNQPTDITITKSFINIYGKFIYVATPAYDSTVEDKILRLTLEDCTIRAKDPVNFSSYGKGAFIGYPIGDLVPTKRIVNTTSNINLPADNSTSQAKATASFSPDVPQGFTYYNSEMAANMICLSADITPEDSSTTTRVWRNAITGKTYLDDNTEYPSADSGSSFSDVTVGFSYFNTLANAFVTCTEISGSTPVWARMATAEILDPSSDPIPEPEGQATPVLNEP